MCGPFVLFVKAEKLVKALHKCQNSALALKLQERLTICQTAVQVSSPASLLKEDLTKCILLLQGHKISFPPQLSLRLVLRSATEAISVTKDLSQFVDVVVPLGNDSEEFNPLRPRLRDVVLAITEDHNVDFFAADDKDNVGDVEGGGGLEKKLAKSNAAELIQVWLGLGVPRDLNLFFPFSCASTCSCSCVSLPLSRRSSG